MRYVMRQKLVSIGDDFTIKDAEGRDVFYVDGKVFSLRDKLIFKDGQGNEVARIERKLIAIAPTWEIYRDGRPYATVKKSLFSLLHAKFSVDIPGPDDLEARGNLLEPRVHLHPRRPSGRRGVEEVVLLDRQLRRRRGRGGGRRAHPRLCRGHRHGEPPGRGREG